MREWLSDPGYWIYAAVRWHWREILGLASVFWIFFALGVLAAGLLK